ncbi:helix-turn-helix domain-containing protein [Bradyrhizobium sp. HKCCYLS2038]|uniref:helix-turn-helix domain-containing protein n=1 Tax=Bradyrhizobium sp. HKCCYLS2038 TaxID=3420764 RepID=UPI003EB6B527
MSSNGSPKMRLGTVREACKEGAMSAPTLYRMMRAGQVKAYRRGTRTLIDLDSLITDSGLRPWTPLPSPVVKRKRKTAESVA